jgi:hypothetical protein
MVRQALPLVLLAAFAACSGNSPAPAASPADSAQAGPGPAGPAATGAATAAAAAKPAPKTVDDCKAIAAASTTDDPSANTAQANGTSERSAAMNALMAQKRPGFRCCFDIWADKIPEAKLYTKAALSLLIDPKGALKKANAKAEENGAMLSDEVAGCLGDVAGSLTYPPASNGKETTYNYHFDFKPRARRNLGQPALQ